MNYYGAKELAESFRVVRGNTITIAEELPEDRYAFRPAPETRTVGELLAHIALAYSFHHQVHAVEHRSSMEGFDFVGLMQRLAVEEKAARSKEQTLAMLRSSGEKWATWLDGVTESVLAERVSFGGDNGGSKSRFEMILSVKEHEMHYRGQLMLDRADGGAGAAFTRAQMARRAAMAAGGGGVAAPTARV